MTTVTFNKPSEEPPATEVPGKYLAQRLSERMSALGCEISTVDMHGDYAWSWVVKCHGTVYYFILGGNRDGISGQWLIDFRPRFGVMAWLKKTRYAATDKRLTDMLSTILQSYDDVSELTWQQLAE
jgi:hypothetical protein